MSINYTDVLEEAGSKLYEEAKRLAAEGASEESALLTRGAIVMKDAAKLPPSEFLMSAESIAKGVLYGTTRIAEDKARAFWSNLIKSSLEFAAGLAGGLLDLTGLSEAKP